MLLRNKSRVFNDLKWEWAFGNIAGKKNAMQVTRENADIFQPCPAVFVWICFCEEDRSRSALFFCLVFNLLVNEELTQCLFSLPGKGNAVQNLKPGETTPTFKSICDFAEILFFKSTLNCIQTRKEEKLKQKFKYIGAHEKLCGWGIPFYRQC